MDQLQLWWLSLGIFAAVIVVVALLLGMIIAAAKNIDSHARNIWIVGKQIAGNTVSIWMLETTVESLRAMSRDTGSLATTATSMDEKLRAIAAGKK